MIKELTEEQIKWVQSNHHKYSWRRLAEEFDKVWEGSFEYIVHTPNDGTEWIGYYQEDGMWLCEQADIMESEEYDNLV